MLARLLIKATTPGRGRDHPDIGPEVCDGLIQMHVAMKQHVNETIHGRVLINLECGGLKG